MLGKLKNLFRKATQATTTGRQERRFRPSFEPLEDRNLMAAYIGPYGLVIQGTPGADYVVVNNYYNTGFQFYQVNFNGQVTNFWAGSVPTNNVYFYGGEGSDYFCNNVGTLNAAAFGDGGNDYLVGDAGNDYLSGGSGDDTLYGYGNVDDLWGGAGNDTIYGMGGDDKIYGGSGNDYLYGQDGHDTLYGQDDWDNLYGGEGNDRVFGGDYNDNLYGEGGNDQLFGGQGPDFLSGGLGDDTLISIDDECTDWLWGNEGFDSFWGDRGWWWFQSDSIYDADYREGGNVHLISSFSNGADKTLDGDWLADPIDDSGNGQYFTDQSPGATYKSFWSKPLFASDGPSEQDIKQGAVGDCWLLASLGAAARSSPNSIRQTIVDLGDGTYAVQLGSNYYRVDADLPTTDSWNYNLTYAQLGREDSLWVALTEKAWAYHRRSWWEDARYSRLATGRGEEGLGALRGQSITNTDFSDYASGQDILNDIANRLNGGQAVYVGITTPASGVPLVPSHAYIAVGVNYDSFGQVVSIVLRNPWGVDGPTRPRNDTSDGLITMMANQLFNSIGRVTSAWV